MASTNDLRGSYYSSLQKLFKYLGTCSQSIFTANDVAALDVSLTMFDPHDASFLASPAFFFRPMPEKVLNHEYSIDEELLDEGCRRALDFADIDVKVMESRKGQKTMPQRGAMDIYLYLDSRLDCITKKKGPRSRRRSLAETSQWWNIDRDDSFFGEDLERHGFLASTPSKTHPEWRSPMISEWFNRAPRGQEDWPEPHIFLVAINFTFGDENEGCLLFGELGYLAQAIVNHLQQPEFQDTSFFPVLLISLFGPRHGRIIQANFDSTSRKLNVRMSRIFSFLKKDEAPLDLFMQFYASIPRREDELGIHLETDDPNDNNKPHSESSGPGKENLRPRE